MSKKSLTAVNILILAAGQGKRMGGTRPKVLHTIGRRSMLSHVVATALELGEILDVAQIGIVHGPDQYSSFQADIAAEFPNPKQDIIFTEQTERLGTGHAVRCGLPAFNDTLPLLVLYGDQPLMGAAGLTEMMQTLQSHALCIAGFKTDHPHGFGRLLKDSSGGIAAIVEEKDATEDQREINLCNAGLMALSTEILPSIQDLEAKNAAKEFYLTDLVALANTQNLSVQHITFSFEEMASVNTLAQLAATEALWQQNKRVELLQQGVQMLAPETVYFSVDTNIAPGCFIEPNVVFARGVSVAKDTRILAFSHLEQANIGQKCQIGPYARIRPKTVLEDDVKIGNFVEIKNSRLQSHVRANHLAYLGDSFIEQRVNIGAGTITCNYDGQAKYITHIGENAFIGTNSSLVAPLNIGKNSIVGAGSVISDDIEDDDLSLERNKQVIIRGGVKRHRERKVEK